MTQIVNRIFSFLLIAGWIASSTISLGQSGLAQWSEFYDSVKKDLRSDEVSVQVEAISRFEKQDNRDAAEFLISLLEKDRAETALLSRAAEVLATFENEDAKRMLDSKVESNPDRSPFLLSAYLAGNPKGGTELAIKVALASSRDHAIQRAAIEGVADLTPIHPKTVSLLIPFLEEKNYHAVRKSTANTLGRLSSSEAIPTLIQSLTDKVIGSNARDALLRLTGETHWRDQDAWNKWWEANRGQFSSKPMDDASFATIHAKLMEEKGDNAMAVEFYEREVTGKNIVFLLDRSGSMSSPTDESGIERMEKLKSELTSLVGRLNEDYSIGFVMFPLDLFPGRGIEPVTPRFSEKATKYIEKLAPSGGTPMGEAIDHTYDKIVEKYNVDTIYLLSDGAPSDIKSPELIQKMLGNADRFGVTVNCISIGRNSTMLKQIATDSGGQYWESM